MKSTLIVFAAVVGILAGVVGCGRDSSVSTPQSPVGPGIDQIAELHNVFLEIAIDDLCGGDPGAKAAVYPASSWDEKVDTGWNAANTMLISEGLEPITRDLAEQIMLDGRQHAIELANTDVVLMTEFVTEVLGNDIPSVDYYSRYVELRQTMTSEDAYTQASAELGTPTPRTDLAVMMDTMLKSDEFWSDVYPEVALPGGGVEKSWLKVIKFIAVVATDAGSGALAGAGYGAIGGPGGSVAVGAVGAVVGGLASWGAGDIMS